MRTRAVTVTPEDWLLQELDAQDLMWVTGAVGSFLRLLICCSVSRFLASPPLLVRVSLPSLSLRKSVQGNCGKM